MSDEKSKIIEETKSSLQEEFVHLQKSIDEKASSLEKKEKDLENKEKNLQAKEKSIIELNLIQITIPVAIYVLIFMSILIFGFKFLITSIILVIGIILWGILTLRYKNLNIT